MRAFSMRRTKGRIITEDKPEHYEVVGQVDEDGTTTALAIQAPTIEVTAEEMILAALDNKRLGRSALADAVDLNATGTKFREALKAVVEADLIRKADDGLYERVEA